MRLGYAFEAPAIYFMFICQMITQVYDRCKTVSNFNTPCKINVSLPRGSCNKQGKYWLIYSANLAE